MLCLLELADLHYTCIVSFQQLGEVSDDSSDEVSHLVSLHDCVFLFVQSLTTVDNKI